MVDARRRTVVYVTSGIFGYLYRFLPIGHELLRRGHRVVVVSASGQAIDHARRDGFEVRHLAEQERAWAAAPDAEWPAPIRPIARRIPGLALGPRGAARAAWEVRARLLADPSELVAALDDVAADLVVTEAEEHRDIRAVIGLGVPVVVFEDLYSTRPGPDVPFPARSHQVPDGSMWSRARARARWERFVAVEAVRRRADRWWVDGHDATTVLDRLAAASGIADAAIGHRYLQFHDYRDLPRIRTVAPELAFPGEPQPPTVVGPVVDPERRVHDVDPGFEERWQQALARRDEGVRLVYVSLGTFLSGLADLTRTVIDGVRAVPRTEVIVSVGRDRELWEGTVADERVAVFGRVPQMRVLAAADAAVSTGGLNTGHEALWFGVPVLNLPVAGLDTPGNAARLVYHGAGRRLRAGEISTAAVAGEVAALLDDPRYRARAAALGDVLRSRDAVGGAVAVIEAELDGR